MNEFYSFVPAKFIHFYEFLLVSIFVHVKFKILFSTIESYLGFCKADENYIFLLWVVKWVKIVKWTCQWVFFLAFIFFERYYCFHLNRYKLALRLSYSFSCYQTTNHGLCYLFLFLLCCMEGFLYFFIIILHLVTSKKH